MKVHTEIRKSILFDKVEVGVWFFDEMVFSHVEIKEFKQNGKIYTGDNLDYYQLDENYAEIKKDLKDLGLYQKGMNKALKYLIKKYVVN